MAEPSSPYVAPRQSGGAGRGFMIFIGVLLILGLGALVVYLLSDINARRYRLNATFSELVVEKGRYMPFGFGRFVPAADVLKEAYKPIPLPKNERFDRPEVFNDRADLDRELFSILAGWARRGLRSEDAEELKFATQYIERCQRLPGLSEQQRVELRTLRADLAYRSGRWMLSRSGELLNEALVEFQLSKELGTSRATNADQWIAEIQRRVAAYGHLPFDTLGTPMGRLPGTAPLSGVEPSVSNTPGAGAGPLAPGSVAPGIMPPDPTMAEPKSTQPAESPTDSAKPADGKWQL